MISREWTFSVKAGTRKGEVVCVTGDCEALGRWSPANAVQMARVDGTDEEVEGRAHETAATWVCSVKLPEGEEVEFRYAVCMFVERRDPAAGTKVVVRRWETNLLPRKIGCHGK